MMFKIGGPDYAFLKILIAALICYPGKLLSQESPALNNSLPDLSKSHIINADNSNNLPLHYKNKLVILDFWATWCSSCIKAFPKLVQIQEKYKDQLQIILVNSTSTRDSKEKITGLINRWQQQQQTKLNLPIIIEDTLLSALYPHNIVPHYVWFDKSGNPIGTTSSDQVNASTIADLLDNKNIMFNTKNDINMAFPLFITSNYPSNALQQYSIFIKGWQPSMPSGSTKRSTGNIQYGWAITNMPLVNIYKMIFARMYPEISPKQFLIEVKDSAQFIPPTVDTVWESWIKDNLYSVDVIVPVHQAENLLPYMLDYMNQISGLIATVEKRKIPCWVLRLADGHQVPNTKGLTPTNDLESLVLPRLINSPISRLTDRINELEEAQVTINETGIKGNVDLYFSKPLKTMETIQKDLLKNGLRLDQEERALDVVVIREKADN